MDRLFFTALVSVLLFLGSAGPAQAELTRKVDCDAGQSLAKALEASDGYGGTLNIIVKGTCQERVSIQRDRVSIVGEEGATIVGRVTVLGPANVTLENLVVTGPGNGVSVLGGRTRIRNCTIQQNEGVGVNVSDGASVIVNGGEVSENAAVGVLVENAALHVRNGARVVGNDEDGIRADRQGSVLLESAIVEDNHQSGIQLWLHSTLDLTEETQVKDNWDLDIYAVDDSAIRVSSGEVSVTGVIACDDYESSFRIVEGAEDADIDLSQVYCTDFN